MSLKWTSISVTKLCLDCCCQDGKSRKMFHNEKGKKWVWQQEWFFMTTTMSKADGEPIWWKWNVLTQKQIRFSKVRLFSRRIFDRNLLAHDLSDTQTLTGHKIDTFSMRQNTVCTIFSTMHLCSIDIYTFTNEQFGYCFKLSTMYLCNGRKHLNITRMINIYEEKMR
jgi:hypothetical protein